MNRFFSFFVPVAGLALICCAVLALMLAYFDVLVA